jgi:predicted aldo/keto reductase-like oxidoreductase
MSGTGMTRRQTLAFLTAGAAGLGGSLYGLSRAGVIKFLDHDAKDDDPMQLQRLPYPPEPGWEISRLGFGGIRLPILNRNDTEMDYELGQKLVDYGVRHGMNYFDTGWVYHHGQGEVFFGKVLKKYPRASFMLADKMPTWLVHSLAEAKRFFEEQLKRCQVEYFDNYLLHSIGKFGEFQNVYEKMGVLDYLKEEKARGRIRHLGFSFHSAVPTMEYLLEKYTWDFALIMLNCLEWDEESEHRQSGYRAGTLYRMLTAKKLPVFVMEPLSGGRVATLNGKAKKVLEADRPGKSLASWGLRFVASLPNVQVILSGMNKLDQVVDNVRTLASDFTPMTRPERETYGRALAEFHKYPTIPCTGCRYCMPCPYGVLIPETFAWYNSFAGEGLLPTDSGPNDSQALRRKFLVSYNNAIPPPARANHCIGCRKCLVACPQWTFRIPVEMQKIEKFVAQVRTQYEAKKPGKATC